MAKRLQHRYYGVFAVNPKDPSDFYGYCENSFLMGWFRHHVSVWQGLTEAQYHKELRWDSYHLSQRLFDWNWMKNYPQVIPHGYVLKAYRLNSKHCPYAVDFNYMLNLTRGAYKKWMYRNPKCKFEGVFQPDAWKVWINDARIEYSGKLDKIKNRVDMDKVSKRDQKQYDIQKKMSSGFSGL